MAGNVAQDNAPSYKFDVGFIENSVNSGNSAEHYNISFQSVFGLGSSLEVEGVHSGGVQNFIYNFPKKVSYSNLVFSKGRIGSNSTVDDQIVDVMALEERIYKMFENFQFVPIDVIVNSLSMVGKVLSAWHVRNALPVGWSLSGFDASSNSILIDRLEFSYSELRMLEI